MARIRTIKPEFPQSESMGRVSRDARLLFILLWTLADDGGRLRGNSRMLASLLYPYDDDAKGLIEGWLGELEGEGCVGRYSVDGDSYIEIFNWQKHQKIDKPSLSKIPAFDESSRILANPREVSSEDQGSRTKDQGKDLPPTGVQGDIKKSRKPSWQNAHPSEVIQATQEIKAIWPTPGADQFQPDMKTLVPGVSTSELASRLADIAATGADLSVCVQIARRAVTEWQNGKWIKAPQHFFGKAKDAPYKAYYQAFVTNSAVKLGRVS